MHSVLVGKPEGKNPLGRPRRRWEDNIKMDLQEVGGGCVDWMELARDRDRWRAPVSTVRNLRVNVVWYLDRKKAICYVTGSWNTPFSVFTSNMFWT